MKVLLGRNKITKELLLLMSLKRRRIISHYNKKNTMREHRGRRSSVIHLCVHRGKTIYENIAHKQYESDKPSVYHTKPHFRSIQQR